MVHKLVGLLVVAAALAVAPAANAQTIPGQYIVVLKDSVGDPNTVASEHGRKYGAQRSHTYRYALKGYAAAIPSERVAAVKSDSRVAFVEEEQRFRVAPVAAGGKLSPCQTTDSRRLDFCQIVPTWLKRIGGDRSSTRSGDGRGVVNVNVAVLDSGIDVDHPDLNVVGGTSCTGSPSYDDQYGHGTLSAGIIGARDNDTGIVGLAPSGRLWAVEVLSRTGVGSTSSVLCGVDSVSASRFDSDATNDVVVANMSLGGREEDDGQCGLTRRDALHQAICRSTAAGVIYTASAGNEALDLQSFAPANYDEVLTATALADSDGLPGGLAGAACGGQSDDTAATFSNFATLAPDAAHTAAARGTCVSSTWPLDVPMDGGTTAYAYSTGTSFASPQLAGIAALCVSTGACTGTPAQIIQKLVADAAAYNQSNPGYGFAGDPLRPMTGKFYGYLIRAGLY